MKTITRIAFIIGLPALMAPVCTAAPAGSFDPNLLAAQVGQTKITLGALHDVVIDREIYQNNPTADAKRLRELLDALIDDELVRQEARRTGLKDRYGALSRIRRSHAVAAGNLYFADYKTKFLKLDSATIDTFYHNHITRYSAPEDQRRPRVITVWKKEGAPQGFKNTDQDSVYKGWYPEDKIDSIYTRLAAGEDFAVLAWKYSEDGNSRGTFGDLGWVTRYALGSGIFADLALSQPLHMISKPFATDRAWHILQVTDERSAGPIPLDDEIREDIESNLMEQQHAIFVAKTGDSLMAMTPIDWNPASVDLPHDQLRNETVLVVVNKRDTVFGEEFLLESELWMRGGLPPDAERRMHILNENHVRLLCWMNYLRELGYLDRPEAIAERDRITLSEQEAIVRQRINNLPINEPDSADIKKYYQDSIHIYGTAPTALRLAWNSIRLHLLDLERQKAMARWRREVSARVGVTRYDDRVATVPLLAQLPSRR